MKPPVWKLAGSVLLVAALALAHAARADVEVAGPDGRRVLLMDNGTWRYVEEKDKNAADAMLKKEGEAILLMERRADIGNGCRFGLRIVNNLLYEIHSLAPYYSAYLANGVIYDTVSSASQFAAVKPGTRQYQEIEFKRIACRDIVRVQVVRGDRCEMGELGKFSDEKGQCLARVRVVETDLVRFDK